MTYDVDTALDELEGRAWEIAQTVRRGIKAAAPYAEAGFAFGHPTWFLHSRVLSLVPMGKRCKLYFWDGAAVERHVGMRMQGGGSEIRYIVLESMLDVNAEVLDLISAAFQVQIERLAASESRVPRKASLPA
ncbi:MAG: DUF1801 domain-containing protein [Pseudomonadota bacterium]